MPSGSRRNGFQWIDEGRGPRVVGEIVRDGTTIKKSYSERIGYPGEIHGLIVGEGGSYKDDLAGTEVVKMFQQDVSAASGSQFTALALDAQNTWLGDAGDRIFVGSPYKFWAVRAATGVAKTAEILELYYWNGALVQSQFMGILQDSLTTLATAIFEQTGEKEYVNLCPQINGDWVAADNVLDTIPNTGSNLYWICFQVPAGGLATPPRTDEIRVRGTEIQISPVSAAIIRWGDARETKARKIPIDIHMAPAGTPSATVAITPTQSLKLYQFRSAQNDDVSLTFKLPRGIDTSCCIGVDLDFIADAIINTANIRLDMKTKKNGEAVGGGAAASEINATTNILTVANVLAIGQDLTAASKLDISRLSEDDEVTMQIQRTGAGGGSFYPVAIAIRYTAWREGSQV